MNRLLELQDRRNAAIQSAEALIPTESRALTAEETSKIEEFTRAAEAANREIDLMTRLASQRRVTEVHDNASDRPWSSMGEFLIGVRAAALGKVDPRLTTRAASGMSEGVPADGGYLVSTQWSNELMTRAYENGTIASKCRRIPIGPNASKFSVPYADETSRVAGSRWGGVQVYRAAEAATVTATAPKLGRLEIELSKLMALCYATDESLQDATSLEAYIRMAFADEMAFVLDNEIVAGNGAGQCLGILNAACTVSVTKEASQVATTFVAHNAFSMWSRLWAKCRPNAVWLINQDVEPQLPQMNVKIKNVAGTENVGGAPVFVPMNGISGQPYATLYGRPIIPVEQCKTLGTVGDVILADLSQYLLVEKGGVVGDTSMHVRFLYDEQTFRWTYRINGAPKWKSALTPANGTNTLAPFVTVETRS